VKLFLDACIIIYWVESAEPFHGRLMTLLKKLREQEPEAKFSISRLSFLECRVHPLKQKNQELLDLYDQFFRSQDLGVVELTPGVIDQATSLKVRYSLRTPDALQAASALSLKEEVIFLTGDKTFKKVESLTVTLV